MNKQLTICIIFSLGCVGCSPHADPKASEFVRSFAQTLYKGNVSAAYQMCTANYRGRADKDELSNSFDVDPNHSGAPILGKTEFLGEPQYDSVLFIDKGAKPIGWFSQEITPGGGNSPVKLKVHVCEENGKFLFDGGGKN